MINSILGNAIHLLSSMLWLYEMAVFAAVMLTWVDPDPHNPIVRFLRQITEPALRPFRRWFRPLTVRVGLDVSPIGLLFLLMFVQSALNRLLLSLGVG